MVRKSIDTSPLHRTSSSTCPTSITASDSRSAAGNSGIRAVPPTFAAG